MSAPCARIAAFPDIRGRRASCRGGGSLPVDASPAPDRLATRDPVFLASRAPVAFADGFYAEERNGEGTFRWMRAGPPPVPRRGRTVSRNPRLFGIPRRLPGADGRGGRSSRCAPGGLDAALDRGAAGRRGGLTVSRIFRRPTTRVTGASSPFASGRRSCTAMPPDTATFTAARSMPPSTGARCSRAARSCGRRRPVLGIDLYAACNIKPPCVYCEWDFNKGKGRRRSSARRSPSTPSRMGRDVRQSAHLVNCSIGEPFMMRNFDELLDVFGRAGKTLELSTNGQLLTDRNIERSSVARSISTCPSMPPRRPHTRGCATTGSTPFLRTSGASSLPRAAGDSCRWSTSCSCR